nr:reverse transcriptase domain-containing protein [Tanacetum cinerariifolium]
MSTHSSARNLFPPLDNPELTIQRRSRTDPTLLNDFEMAAEGTGDLPVPDLQTMEELCQTSFYGRGGPIAPIAIQETNFRLKNDMIQQSIKVNGVTDDTLRLYLFPHSLIHHASTWFDRLPRNSINTFEQMAKMFLGKYFPPSMVAKLKNEIINFRQRPDESLFEAWECYKLSIDRCPNHNMLPATQIDTFYNGLNLRHRDTINVVAEIAALKAEMAEINKNLIRVLQVNQQVKAVTPNCETCGGPHSFFDFPATVGNTQNVYVAGAYQGNSYQPQGNRNILTNRSDNYLGPPGFNQNQNRYNQNQNFHNQNMNQGNHNPQGTTKEGTNSLRVLAMVKTHLQLIKHQLIKLRFTKLRFINSRFLNRNTNTNPKEDLKGITTRSGTAYQGPTIPTTSSSLPPVVEHETDATKDTPVASLVSALRPNQRPLLPYPSRFQDQNLRDKANDQREKFFQIFKDLNFNISFTDALIVMPKFGPSIKTLLTNKDKLYELSKSKEVARKLGDPGKFLIPCDFPGMAKCLALADLGASINLIPLSVWNKLSLLDLSPTFMTLELADRLISRPVGVSEDVFVKVGTFHFLATFVVIDFNADPRVPLILKRSFLKTRRALINVFEGELTLCVGKEAITFNLDQTSRYSANYSDMTANRIDVIDMACEEYSQEVLGFFDVIASGNPTPYYDPIVSTTSPTLTPFENGDFLLEEVDAFLALEDDPTSPKVDQSYVDTKEDTLLLEAFLNDDPSLLPPNQGNYFPKVRKELKICEAKSNKSLINQPPEVELKDLPPHLEYVFLEGDDKLPVIIAKDLSVEEKTSLMTVLKSHKRAITWKLSDIKGIDPEFCTHKILMEEDFEPAVQHQRRVNPKIHDVIKNEVIKLLDAGLIYLISDSPWVCPVQCVPKKDGFTVVENEENELILTRLVMGWRVCIDDCRLNEATRKDHFPLPHMDQMLKRLVGNQYYCFLDGFSSYFQIPIDPKDQEKTTFTFPYRTFAYRRMPFGLYNAPGMFHRCMMAIFPDMIEKPMEVFMDDFSEKIHFIVKEGIVLGHKISKEGIEVDKAKVEVIAKLPHPTTFKGIRSFLGHAGFYRRFIKDFSKIARPMTTPILIALDWDFPFELMCDASDFAIGEVLGQRQEKHFRPMYYANNTMTEAESNYTTTEKEMLTVVYGFEKFRSYLIMNKSIVYTDHSALKYLFAKKDSKARLLRWVLLL